MGSRHRWRGDRGFDASFGAVVVTVAMLLVASAALGISAAAPQPLAAIPVSGSFVTTSGTRFMLDGEPWYLYGGSTYGTSNPGGPTSISDLLALAEGARLNTLRIVNMFDERGLSDAAPYEEADWIRVDELLAQMHDAGLHAILDLSAFRNHLENRELHLKGAAAISDGYPIPAECATLAGDALTRCVGTRWTIENPGMSTDPYSLDAAPAWATFLEFVATRVNTVTGVEYREDPTIALVAFAGEPHPPDSGEALKPGTQELTDFYERVFDEWKAHDPNHLVTSGGLLHIDWEEVYGDADGSGIDHEAIFALPNQDVLSIHNYFPAFPPTSANDAKTPKIAAAAASTGKPWITEEFGFTQAPIDTSTDPDSVYTESDRADWYQGIYDTQLSPPVGVPSAGVAFWNLGPEVAGASHDVNPDTPATWAVVRANSPIRNVFTVNTRSDANGACTPDDCSLREAIRAANATPNAALPDRIRFAVAGSIHPSAALPPIIEPIVIDGTTAPGFDPDMGAPVVEIDGSYLGMAPATGTTGPTGSVGNAVGLTLHDGSDGSTIRGLAINRFTGVGIGLFGTAGGHTIVGNWIGLALDGTSPAGNEGDGIQIQTDDNTIGGSDTSDRNVIAANSRGVAINPGASGNRVEGNYIGTDRSGQLDVGNEGVGIAVGGDDSSIGGPNPGQGNVVSGNESHGVNVDGASNVTIEGNQIGVTATGDGPLGNAQHGVLLQGSVATVGGIGIDEANTIAFNGRDGVSDASAISAGNSILANSIHDNDRLGIDLGGDGAPTPNDPGDTDGGPNGYQNAPVLDAATGGSGSSTVAGYLDSGDGDHRIEVFRAGPTCDPSGYGEGATFLGAFEAAPGSFSETLDATLSDGDVITATATAPDGSTSEFSACLTATSVGSPLEITDITPLVDPVPRYGRFEAQITLNETFANPFDPDEIMVDVEFTAPSGAEHVVPAFWSEDFTSHIDDSWGGEVYQPVAGSEGWRVRFAPTEIGTYVYVVSATDPGGTAISEAGTFTVEPSEAQGFVRVDPEDPLHLRYERGAPYIPIGHNAGWELGHRGTFYYAELLPSFERAGENWTRIWMTDFNRSALEWSAGHWSGLYDGVGRYSLASAWRLDRILDVAANRGVMVQLVLSDHGQFAANDRWAGNPYSDSNGGPVPAARPDLFFSDPLARELFERRLRYVVARWGANTNVLAWELFNEVQYVGTAEHNPYVDPEMWADVLDWHADMAAYLGAIDPYDHLVTSSSDPAPAGPDLGSVAGIDVVQIHDYRQPPSDRGPMMLELIGQLRAAHGKPVIVGETGIRSDPPPEAGFDPLNCSKTQAECEHLLQGTHMHNAVWTAAMTGSGAMSWWWDSYIQADTTANRVAPDFPLNERVFPPLVAFLEGEDPAAEGMAPTDLEPSSDVFAAGLDNGERALVWIRDIENEYGTGARPGDLVDRTILGATVTLNGLPTGDYLVEVFDPYGTGGRVDTFMTSGPIVELPAFERDIAIKVSPAGGGVTELVSVAWDGGPANGPSFAPDISDSGRFVAFYSDASDLLPPGQDANGVTDVFVRDLATGSTVRASVADDGSEDPLGIGVGSAGRTGVMSGDARFVVFRSRSGSLAEPTLPDLSLNGECYLYLRDLALGSTSRIELPGESVACPVVVLSDDGSHIAFISGADDLVAGQEPDGSRDVFRMELATGAVDLVSSGPLGEGELLYGGPTSTPPGSTNGDIAISRDGRFVAFHFRFALVPEDGNRYFDTYLHDLQTGNLEMVSVRSDGTAGEQSECPPPECQDSNTPVLGVSLTDDGGRVLFTSPWQLHAADTGSWRNAYVRDRVDPAQTILIGPTERTYANDITSDGGAVTLESVVPYTAGDSNNRADIFLRTVPDGPFELISITASGAPANDHSSRSVIDASRRFVAFDSGASNMVPGDTNGVTDIFLRDRFGGGGADAEPPSVEGLPDREPNEAGWYNAHVTVDWVATDPEPSSGAPSDPPDTIAATEGQSVLYTSAPSCDPVGNCATGSLTLSIDRTPPTTDTVDVPPAIGATSPTIVSVVASDALSGVAGGEFWIDADPGIGDREHLAGGGSSWSGLIPAGLTSGEHTLHVRVRDAADNWGDLVSVALRVTGTATLGIETCSLEQDRSEDEFDIQAYAEQGRPDVTLCGSLLVDIIQPGTYGYGKGKSPLPATKGSISAGTQVRTFLVHTDDLGSSFKNNEYMYVRGRIVFDRPILGVIVSDPLLESSDVLGASGAAYPTGLQNRGTEVGNKINPYDEIDLGKSRTTLTFTTQSNPLMDQIRIVTEAGAQIVSLKSEEIVIGKKTFGPNPIEQVPSPCSLRSNVFELDEGARIIHEQFVQAVTLCDALTTDIGVPGTYTRADPPNAGSEGVIPAGTVVRSHLLHADRLEDFCCFASGDFAYFTATVTFDEEILGIVTSDARLDASDLLGAAGTTYPTGWDDRGLDFALGPGTANDEFITLSADRRSITVRFHVGNGLDEIRVVTAAT
jgi:CSLREA domain-containing protein